MKKLLYLFCLLVFSQALQAQHMSLYFMDDILQGNLVNPAFMPDRKIVYSFPSLGVQFTNSIGAYNSLISENAEGVTVLDTRTLLNLSDDQNFVRFGYEMYSTHSMFGNKLWRVSISHAVKGNNYFEYPKALVKLAAEGNAAFLGETVEVAPDFDFTMYSETALGFALNLGKINAGARLKLISGIANVSADKTSTTLTTDPEYYQLDVATDYRINAAGLFELSGLSGDSDFEADFNGADFSVGDWFSKNLSLGVDLGASMSLMNDKLKVSTSIIDLGKIKWNNNVYNFHSNGQYRFEGVDLNETFEEGDISLDEALDTLSSVFDFEESHNGYATFLPTKVYMSGSYKVNRWVSGGGLLLFERYQGNSFTGIALDVTAHLWKILDFGLTGSRVYGATSLGMHMALKLGPVQLILASDNALALINPFDHKMASGRFGLNLAFGKLKPKDALSN